MNKCIPFPYLMFAGALLGTDQPGNWTGKYVPCERHVELLKREPMSIGVRFSTSNRQLPGAFARAMDFWATILDMEWHREDGRDCAIQIVDGDPALFKEAEIARAQFPQARSFQGWIAFNRSMSLSANQLFVMAVHELGHVLGLPHSSNSSSVMYFLQLDGPVILDDADIVTLATRHQLRVSVTKKNRSIQIRVAEPVTAAAHQPHMHEAAKKNRSRPAG